MNFMQELSVLLPALPLDLVDLVLLLLPVLAVLLVLLALLALLAVALSCTLSLTDRAVTDRSLAVGDRSVSTLLVAGK